MFEIRPSGERGQTKIGWLDSRHTFSFGEYYDPSHMGFSSLRVINDDRVAAGAGFGTHGHRDMEIISYVLEGALEHKDSLGTGSVIRPGEIQMMRAGTGVSHSEFNQSKTAPVHFLQIWIVPDSSGLQPAYAQQPVDEKIARDSFALLVSRDGRDGSIRIHQDVDLWLARVPQGAKREIHLGAGRKGWVHVAQGSVLLNDFELTEGDGGAITNEQSLHFVGVSAHAQVLFFDLA